MSFRARAQALMGKPVTWAAESEAEDGVLATGGLWAAL